MRRPLLSVMLVAFLAVLGTSIVQAQTASPVQLIPVVVKAKGRAGTLWRSDVSITNLTNTTQTVTAAYLPEDRANIPPLQYTHSISLGPNQTVVVEDVIGKWFSQFGDNTKGALMVYIGEPSLGGTVAHIRDVVRAGGEGEASPALTVTSRAYNAANPEATYGQTVPPDLFSFFFGIATAKLTGIRQDSRFRTNIGVINFSPLSAPVQITVYDGNGTQLARKTKTVPAFSLSQWNLKTEFGVDGLSNGLVDLRVDPSTAGQDPCGDTAGSLSPLLMAYYSKNDNNTGDAEFAIAATDWRDLAAQCNETPMDGCPTAY